MFIKSLSPLSLSGLFIFAHSLEWYGIPRAVSLRPYTLDKSFWGVSFFAGSSGLSFSSSYTLQKMAIIDDVRFKYFPDLYDTKQHQKFNASEYYSVSLSWYESKYGFPF